jgi:hypothetical protein
MPHCCNNPLLKWKRFLGGLSPARAFFFQLLLAALFAANLAGIILSVKRLQSSNDTPVSSLSVRSVSVGSLPSVSFMFYALNAAAAVSSPSFISYPHWPLPGTACPSITLPFGWGANTEFVAPPFSVITLQGAAAWRSVIGVTGINDGACIGLAVCPVPMPTTSAELAKEECYALNSAFTAMTTCLPSPRTVNASWVVALELSYSATESVTGSVEYSIELASFAFLRDLKDVVLNPPPVTLFLSTPLRSNSDGTEGGQNFVPVSWEQQGYAYSWQDLLATVFANFNISLTIVAFCFPWKQVFHQRKFRCDVDDEFDLPWDSEKANFARPLAQSEHGALAMRTAATSNGKS